MSSVPSAPTWSAVDAALQAAGAVHQMEATGFVVLSGSTATYQRTAGTLPGLDAGLTLPWSETVSTRVLDGAPVALAGVSDDPAFAGTDEPSRLGVRSYVAMPVLGDDGRLHGLLVGLDRQRVTIATPAVTLLRGIADALGAIVGEAERVEAAERTETARRKPPSAPTAQPGGAAARPARPGPAPDGPPARGSAVTPAAPPSPTGPSPTARPELCLRRAPVGWIVEGPAGEVRPVGDLLSAMVLADLLAEDLAPPGRPRRPDHDLTEIEQLRLSVVQLEHALASRVIVEQAIGVLAERHRLRPREAFERLRRTARGMGRRVHDLARQVVESVSDPRTVLPGELAGRGGSPPRPAPPRPNQSRH
ncbi:GAF and ANTAR domain-containing protein [Protofrankia symbiont of Coriaria ruscifolia]|uniref:ANTAR domain-containing protein n=1 Tax=Candidatus Protofrankia californiensis TaxID=1839754 RepID=A0A1C3NVH4_9ACTN|nr:GAF and ANTAR domain-containing protein [Protofrankia symbiont of Coriaria ruscifolia]SBW19430.1 ANTAR domain-containing protein [Candidatus Protofrankia californiensis]